MDGKTLFCTAGLLSILFWIFLSVRRNWRRPRVLAGEKFSEFFREEIQDLSQGKGDAYEILGNAFFKQEKAYLQFRAYLKGKTRQQFDEAWKEYFYDGGENGQPCPQQYHAAGNDALAAEKRHLALKRIGKLLSLAKK